MLDLISQLLFWGKHTGMAKWNPSFFQQLTIRIRKEVNNPVEVTKVGALEVLGY